ncbi:CopG family transcriptional regulator [cyanobacterium TDX16]|nr:CopG family transcriptional regulator [cyanobacterium TDX16]
MQVFLTPELEQFIQAQIESGKFSSAEEVVTAGIKLLEERERIYKGRFEELKKEIEIGIEAAKRGEIVDGETVFRQLREKLQQRRQKAEQ